MTKRLAIANRKGGVGKSTLSFHIAHYAAERGIRTLVVDFDSQGNLSSSLAGRTRLKNLEEDVTISDDLFESDLVEVNPLECRENLYLIPSQINDNYLASRESEKPSITAPRHNLSKVSDQFDLILIDCPPGVGSLMVAGLTAAENIIIPVKVSGHALEGTISINDLVGELRKKGHTQLKISGILVNMFNSRVRSHKEAISILREKAGSLVLNTVIANRGPIDDAINTDEPVWSMRSGASAVAAKEIQSAIKEIFERIALDY